MRELYVSRTGLEAKAVSKMMDSETWLGADEAIEQGFADAVIEVKQTDPERSDKKAKALARRTIEVALAKAGLSRSEREEVFQKAGVRDAVEPDVQRDADAEGWSEVLNILKS